MYVKLIPLLSSDYWVIAMDLLGFGNSDALPWNNAPVPDRARNVNHFIAALGIDKRQLFGLHTGAALGAEVAAAWPEKVRALILFGFPYIESEEERQQIYAHLERSTGVPPTDIAADWTPMNISPDGSHLTVLWARVYSEVLRYWMHSPPPWAPDFYPTLSSRCTAGPLPTYWGLWSAGPLTTCSE